MAAAKVLHDLGARVTVSENSENEEIKKRARELVERIDSEDIPDIREAWLSELMEVARCPKCKGRVRKQGDRVSCRRCDFSVKYLRKRKRRFLLP